MPLQLFECALPVHLFGTLAVCDATNLDCIRHDASGSHDLHCNSSLRWSSWQCATTAHGPVKELRSYARSYLSGSSARCENLYIDHRTVMAHRPGEWPTPSFVHTCHCQPTLPQAQLERFGQRAQTRCRVRRALDCLHRR